MSRKIKITIIFAFLVSLNFFWIPQAFALNFQSSSLTGLATMRKMAKESISYQDAIDNNKSTLLEFYIDFLIV